METEIRNKVKCEDESLGKDLFAAKRDGQKNLLGKYSNSLSVPKSNLGGN